MHLLKSLKWYPQQIVSLLVNWLIDDWFEISSSHLKPCCPFSTELALQVVTISQRQNSLNKQTKKENIGVNKGQFTSTVLQLQKKALINTFKILN